MTLTKSEIIDNVYEKVGGLSKKEASELVEAVYETIKDVLAGGEKVKISRFGNFEVRHKRERVGRNPRTGQSLIIAAHKVVKFDPSDMLRAIMNPHRKKGEE